MGPPAPVSSRASSPRTRTPSGTKSVLCVRGAVRRCTRRLSLCVSEEARGALLLLWAGDHIRAPSTYAIIVARHVPKPEQHNTRVCLSWSKRKPPKRQQYTRREAAWLVSRRDACCE